MTRPPVVGVTRRVPEEAFEVLARAGCEARTNPADRPMSRSELVAMAAEADALLVQLTDRIDGTLLSSAPRLKVVANYAVGYDNVDVRAAAARGVAVTNTPDVLTDATADMAWALLLAAARRVVEGDRLTRSGGFTGWAPLFHLGQGVAGRTLGLVGAGRIAAAVARRARGFGVRLLYWSRTPRPDWAAEAGATYRSLDALLAESDFVSLHVPLNEGTRGLIGARALALMKPTAVLVNTARGPVVDEAALVRALRDRRLFAAGLDVFENEPALAPGLAELPNVVLAPHAGSATFEARGRMARLAAENIVAVLSGRGALTPVRP